MISVGGNLTAKLQSKSSQKNEIGEYESEYTDLIELTGWLDMISGSDSYKYKGKFEESTHVFICDYQTLNIKSNECRVIVNDNVYEVLNIDDPMQLHYHLEILLKYVGVLNG